MMFLLLKMKICFDRDDSECATAFTFDDEDSNGITSCNDMISWLSENGIEFNKFRLTKNSPYCLVVNRRMNNLTISNLNEDYSVNKNESNFEAERTEEQSQVQEQQGKEVSESVNVETDSKKKKKKSKD